MRLDFTPRLSRSWIKILLFQDHLSAKSVVEASRCAHEIEINCCFLVRAYVIRQCDVTHRQTSWRQRCSTWNVTQVWRQSRFIVIKGRCPWGSVEYADFEYLIKFILYLADYFATYILLRVIKMYRNQKINGWKWTLSSTLPLRSRAPTVQVSSSIVFSFQKFLFARFRLQK